MGIECGKICKHNNNVDLSKETNLNKNKIIANNKNDVMINDNNDNNDDNNNENSSEKIDIGENNNLAQLNYKFLKYNADSTMREQFSLSKKSHRLKFVNEINALTILDEEDERCLKTKGDLKMINEAFSQHFFIKSLSEKNKEKIIEEMELATIGPNKIIFKQGFEGLFFYILKNGIVELQINKKIIKKLSKGDSFGEFALLHNAPRSGTIRSITQCELWILERNSFRKIVEESTRENFKENQKFINSVSILRVLEGYQQSLLCSSLYKEIYLQKQVIAREGDDANCIIFIKEGEVNCVKNGHVIRTLHKYDFFGERSIFVEGKRSLDVVAKTNCICYAISFASLEKILGIYYRDELCKQIIKASFLESACFKEISVVYLDKIYKLFLMRNFKKNEVVCATGNYYSDKVIVIIDGNLVKNDSKREVVGKRGELIFDAALLNNSNDEINHDLVADPDCLLVETEPQKIFDLLKVKDFKEILRKSFNIKMLKNSDFLKKLPIDKIEDLLERMALKKFSKNEVITRTNSEGDCILFVRSGSVLVEPGKNSELNKKDFIIEIGYASCIGSNLIFDSFYKETTVAKTEVEILSIDKNLFEVTVGPNLFQYLKDMMLINDKNISLGDLDFLFDLGNHTIKKCSLVRCKRNKKFYTVKCITKSKIISENLFKNMEKIKQILFKIDNPLIVNYVKVLGDNDNVYLLSEYLIGIDFPQAIDPELHPPFSAYQLQFFFASLLLIISYLHKNSVVHRDVQPKNFILKQNGYLALRDLRYCKLIKNRTNSVVGDSFYMAPEVIMGEGYSFEVDYWSVAIIVYELYTGVKPFVGDNDDPMTIYFSIINGKIKFPTSAKNKVLNDLIEKMLQKNPVNRVSKIENIQNSEFFRGFNFNDVEFLKCIPEYFPFVDTSLLDRTNGSYERHAFECKKEWQFGENYSFDEDEKDNYEKWFENFCDE